ncbi:MAG: hypothetical protein H6839_18110 [Planctomycetes bacterium]|nr:hypothetical protein [Planctomycetota bacterium]
MVDGQGEDTIGRRLLHEGRLDLHQAKEVDMLNDLAIHLSGLKSELAGEWVNKNSGYDASLAQILQMSVEGARYWDAVWNGFPIEFKKGQSIWLDLVRYAEVQLGVDQQAQTETATLFFLPNRGRPRHRIDEIVCVKTSDLVRFLGLTTQEAQFLVQLSASMKAARRSLNAQASLKVAEAKSIATFVI